MLPSSTHETNGRTGSTAGTGRHRAVKARRTTKQRLFAGVGLAGIVSLAVPMITANTASATAPAAAPASAPATAPAAVAAAPTSASSTRAADTTTASYYTVLAGDWLSTIAADHDVNGGWQRLYALNRSVLTQGPDLIYPGERLALSGRTAATGATTSSDTVSGSANLDSSNSGSGSSYSAGSSNWSASDSSSSSSSDSATSTTSAPAATTTTTSTSSSSSSTASSSGMAAAIAFAQAQVGDAYVYGGTGPNTWDCSGLTQAALAQAGISIPRTSEDQAAAATPVSMNALQPGDLLFWSTDGTAANAYHVAIYIGNGSYVEAANPSAGVKIDTISDYAPTFAGRF